MPLTAGWSRRYPGDPEVVGFHEAENLCLQDWRRHEADIRRRMQAHEPPSSAWIALITADRCGTEDGSDA